MFSIPRLQVLSIWIESWVQSYEKSLVANWRRDDSLDIHTSPYSAGRNPENIISDIQELNANSRISGIIGLTPTPDEHFRGKVYDHIAPDKDVDCQTSHNFQAFLDGDTSVPFAPATAEAVLKMIQEQWLEKNNVAIVGKWPAVGLPLGKLCKRAWIEYTLIEPWKKLNPNWEDELKSSWANIVVWAARDGYNITPLNVPDGLEFWVDVAYCDIQSCWEDDDNQIKTVGNFSPELVQQLWRANNKKNFEVGRATTRVLIEHVKRAHEAMGS